MYDVNEKLSAHFTLGELTINENIKDLTPLAYNNLKTKAIPMLEWARKKCGNRPIHVTSGYRSWIHQINVYEDLARNAGKLFDLNDVPRSSYHLTGEAVDFKVEGLSSDTARKLLADWGGGMELGTPHVHLDARPYRIRFYGTG